MRACGRSALAVNGRMQNQNLIEDQLYQWLDLFDWS